MVRGLARGSPIRPGSGLEVASVLGRTTGPLDALQVRGGVGDEERETHCAGIVGPLDLVEGGGTKGFEASGGDPSSAPR